MTKIIFVTILNLASPKAAAENELLSNEPTSALLAHPIYLSTGRVANDAIVCGGWLKKQHPLTAWLALRGRGFQEYLLTFFSEFDKHVCDHLGVC